MQNPSSIGQLVQFAQVFSLYGWHLDFEPVIVPGTPSDAEIYADFLGKLKSSLNQVGTRLTINVDSSIQVINQFELLANQVDRMIDLETYNANSMQGWLNGDQWGGNYTMFVNSSIPRSKSGVGLGCYPYNCGNDLCWTELEESGLPRIQRMLKDEVPEIAMQRIYGNQTGDDRWPQEWWWSLLLSYINGSA